MGFEKQNLDVILVPAGLLIMFSYHFFLLFKILRSSENCVTVYENHNKEAWVKRMMKMIKADDKNISQAVTVISSSVSAAIFLSSMCITLGSLIGALIASSSHNIFSNIYIYGDTRRSTISIKFISLLSCFLVAFASFVQSARYFALANFLITSPYEELIKKAVKRGSDFWALGLRALYFAIVLLLWIFGPIPMFACSMIMVTLLYFFYSDSPSNWLQHQKKVDEEMAITGYRN